MLHDGFISLSFLDKISYKSRYRFSTSMRTQSTLLCLQKHGCLRLSIVSILLAILDTSSPKELGFINVNRSLAQKQCYMAVSTEPANPFELHMIHQLQL